MLLGLPAALQQGAEGWGLRCRAAYHPARLPGGHASELQLSRQGSELLLCAFCGSQPMFSRSID